MSGADRRKNNGIAVSQGNLASIRVLIERRTSNMKKAILLGATISGAIVLLAACANQDTSASRASTVDRGTSPGVAGTGGGGGGGGTGTFAHQEH